MNEFNDNDYLYQKSLSKKIALNKVAFSDIYNAKQVFFTKMNGRNNSLFEFFSKNVRRSP